MLSTTFVAQENDFLEHYIYLDMTAYPVAIYGSSNCAS